MHYTLIIIITCKEIHDSYKKLSSLLSKLIYIRIEKNRLNYNILHSNIKLIEVIDYLIYQLLIKCFILSLWSSFLPNFINDGNAVKDISLCYFNSLLYKFFRLLSPCHIISMQHDFLKFSIYLPLWLKTTNA